MLHKYNKPSFKNNTYIRSAFSPKSQCSTKSPDRGTPCAISAQNTRDRSESGRSKNGGAESHTANKFRQISDTVKGWEAITRIARINGVNIGHAATSSIKLWYCSLLRRTSSDIILSKIADICANRSSAAIRKMTNLFRLSCINNSRNHHTIIIEMPHQ